MKVAVAPNQTSAQMMDRIPTHAGIPSLTQPARGFDVPAYLSAGPWDVLVPDTFLGEDQQILVDTTGLGSYGP